MPIPPAPLDPTLGDAFAVADALRTGHTPARMRARDLDTPYRGVRRRIAPEPETLDRLDEPFAEDRAVHDRVVRDARAYFQVAPEGAFVAGRSAAAVWLAHCEPEDDLCIGVFAPHRAPRRPGIRGVAVSPALTKIRTQEGLRVTSPATTWAMLAGELTHRELVILGDAIVRIPRDARAQRLLDRQLASPQQLLAAAMAPHRRHRSALLAALDDIRVGSMSPLETDFRLLSQDEGLPEPQLDVEIRDAGGRLLGIADQAHTEFRTLIEIEGDHHRVNRAQWLRDLEKHAAYAAEGYELVRLGGSQVRGRRPQGARLLRTVLERRGWNGERTAGRI